MAQPAAQSSGARLTPEESLSLMDDLIGRAKRAGADEADALLVQGEALSAAVRLREPEKTEREEGSDLGLRVFVGRRQAILSTTDMRSPALDAVVEQAIAMARAVPEDDFCGLADPAQLAVDPPVLDSCDPTEPSAERLLERARAAEATALEDPGVTNSEGAEASWSRSSLALLSSNGFQGTYSITRFGVGVAVLAGTGDRMERDYDFSSKVYESDLDAAEEIGRSAAGRAVRRLNPRKVKTAAVPVVFDPRVSNGLVGALSGAINGASIARGTSFLKDQMGKQIMAAGLNVIDDPHRDRGLRSKPFDAEGLPNRRRAMVEDGVLQSWFLDLRSARQLGLSSTSHATRGTSSSPGPAPTNLYLEPGRLSPQELIADIPAGLYVTEMLGSGINGVTGDYSRGAAGFWILNGELVHPVSEITVAGNLKSMFMNMRPANDLTFRFGIDAPTVRIEGMTVAGN